MRITSLGASNFLSFKTLDLSPIDPGLTVVVGPNGAGKSNLTRLLQLVGIALASCEGGGAHVDFGRFRDARHLGAQRDHPMVVRVGVEFDQISERSLLLHFMRSYVASGLLADRGHDPASVASIDAWVTDQVTDRAIAPLLAGELVAVYGGLAGAEQWSIGYEFLYGEKRLSWSFRGTMNETVGGGEMADLRQVTTYSNLLQRLRDGAQSNDDPLRLRDFDLGLLLPDGRHERIAGRTESLNAQRLIPSISSLAEGLGIPIPQGNAIGLGSVMHRIYRDALIIVPGQRPPARRFFSATTIGRGREPDDLAALPLELHELQSGDANARGRYKEVQARFRELTGRGLEMQVLVASALQNDEDSRELEPRIVEGGWEVPLELAGAGMWEALVLAHATTAGKGTVVVLDEPAQNLHPTLQRKVLALLLERSGQTLAVTHSPYLIPARTRSDLLRTIRIAKRDGASTLMRLGAVASGQVAEREQEGKLWQTLFASADARGLLFASAVVLCEGGTEVGALEHWLTDPAAGSPSPDGRNIVLFDVGGDERFGFYAGYLDRFGIPWAIVCDSKVMDPRKRNSIFRQLGIVRRTSKKTPAAGAPLGQASFTRLRRSLEEYGVFTLAGAPATEIESVLEAFDPAAWRAAGRSEGANKIRRGRAFAAATERPRAIDQLWTKILKHLETSID